MTAIRERYCQQLQKAGWDRQSQPDREQHDEDDQNIPIDPQDPLTQKILASEPFNKTHANGAVTSRSRIRSRRRRATRKYRMGSKMRLKNVDDTSSPRITSDMGYSILRPG